MAVKEIFTATMLLLTISWLKSIQAINCDTTCYSIQRTVTTPTPDINCFTYRTTLSSAASCSITGNPKLTFYTTGQCDISELDLESVIAETDPISYNIINDNIGIGIQLAIPTNNEPIRICVRGAMDTTTAPLTITDDTNTCWTDFNESVDFCGICNGNGAPNTCFCHTNANDCTNSIRPRGDLTCLWDATNNKCNAVTADICTSSDPAQQACVCWWDEDSCNGAKEEGSLPCDWDALREHCISDECIGDNLACPCMKTKQDCENEIIDFPTACLWDNEECVETEETTFDPTEIPTAIPTTNPFNTIDPFPAPTKSPVVNTIEPTMETSMSPTWNRQTTTTTTWIRTPRPTRNPNVWNKPTKPTYWNKPTKKPGCDDKDKNWDKNGNKDGNKNGNKNGNGGNKWGNNGGNKGGNRGGKP